MSQAFPVPHAARTTALPFATVETLAKSGAILTIASNPVRRHLVGHLAWLGPQRLFWFTAHGDTPDDGHVLEFDGLAAVANESICFYRDGQVAASLAPIARAEVDDPDDYLIAWQLWHEVAPRRTALIQSCLAQYPELEPESPPAADPTRPAGEHRPASAAART